MKLKENQIVAFPTDTIYGVGAKYDDLQAQEKLIEIKQRKKGKRFAVLCANIEQIKKIAIVDETARKVINTFMPGQLTIIMPSVKDLNNYAVGINVAIRIPANKIALALLEENGPLATTSVNVSNEKPINDVNIIKTRFAGVIDYIIEDKDYIKSDTASTIIEIIKGQVIMIRQGIIGKEDIDNVLKS